MDQNSKASKISRKNMKKMNKLQSNSDEEINEDDVDKKLKTKNIQNLNLTNEEKNQIKFEKNKNFSPKHQENKKSSKDETPVKNNEQKINNNNSAKKIRESSDKKTSINTNENQKVEDDDRDNVNLKALIKGDDENEEEVEIQNELPKEENSYSELEEENSEENKDSLDKSENLQKDKYFSNIKFEEFDINPKTLESLKELGFTTATEIQAKTIPLSLSGADIIGSAKTGSGKSLSFLIPAVETIANLKSISGTKVLVLTPTRELALQLYNLAKDLLMYHKETCALTIGGANRKVEAEKLKSGASIVIATPGRFLDHMKNTKGFNFQNLSMLVIDEADAILKIGFEQELKDIISLLPKKRQTLLFSATMNNKLDDIIRLSLKNPIQISTKSHVATVTNLEQGYVVIEPDKKFLLLYTFLRKNPNKKIIVFFSSCKAVEFYAHLLNYVDIPAKSTHGGQKQQKRTATFFEFSNMDKGILLCTDVVQRGLDFPDVDWIIQYDPPHSNILFSFVSFYK